MMSYQTEINLRELWLGKTRQAWLTHLEGLAHRHRPLGQWSLGEWLGYILQGKENFPSQFTLSLSVHHKRLFILTSKNELLKGNDKYMYMFPDVYHLHKIHLNH